LRAGAGHEVQAGAARHCQFDTMARLYCGNVLIVPLEAVLLKRIDRVA
jgi:hypothetical protein